MTRGRHVKLGEMPFRRTEPAEPAVDPIDPDR
jgi:hypothetical protein